MFDRDDLHHKVVIDDNFLLEIERASVEVEMVVKVVPVDLKQDFGMGSLNILPHVSFGIFFIQKGGNKSVKIDKALITIFVDLKQSIFVLINLLLRHASTFEQQAFFVNALVDILPKKLSPVDNLIKCGTVRS